MGWESCNMVRYDLGPLLQGQTRVITCLLLVLEVCNVKSKYRKSWAWNLLILSDLTLCPYLQGQTRTAKLKSAYNSLIIGPRG